MQPCSRTASRSGCPDRTPSAGRSRTATSCSTTPYTGETYAPIQYLPGANASFEVYNSPLSEYAALGFEYGYSVAAPDALVLWEAQFGDFVNGAQIVIDQFLVAGPLEVGSDVAADASPAARLRGERPGALERAAGAVPATGRAGQHPNRELHDGRPVLPPPAAPGARRDRAAARRDDAEGPPPPQARLLRARGPRGRLLPRRHPRSRRGRRGAPADPLQRQGLLRHRRAQRPGGGPRRGAIARLEQLYPFPVEAVAELVAALPGLEEIVWAQEEPQNMGAWRSIRHRLDDAARSSSSVPGVTYVGRSWRASPSEGYPTAHQLSRTGSCGRRSAPQPPDQRATACPGGCDGRRCDLGPWVRAASSSARF